jgi:hypothetical protein
MCHLDLYCHYILLSPLFESKTFILVAENNLWGGIIRDLQLCN